MRIWDIDTGFLNDKSLVAEHRELHGILSILHNHKKGYSHHPETLRWKGHLKTLGIRHDLLVEEMDLRGFNHKTPVIPEPGEMIWPESFINSPHDQYALLKTKYTNKKPGRIPLPKNTLELWAFHKYSVMARDPEFYSATGPLISKNLVGFEMLCGVLVSILRTPPGIKRLLNAVDHMWGYISPFSDLHHDGSNLLTLITEIRHQAIANRVSYLIHSTALGELNFWYQFLTRKGDTHE
ncbi:MAG: hypothetical protein KKE44_08695 [Proteobacteria bacterium]|nr:hypothetical protein [Pseudomonadota bacterium]MBU1582805.1 hypothetical protein [Pseudomonadota bacterium]MBU2453505.1 hypothetical protein [Pseudomonadota bacterium]MBU2631618.1 hypothetical protein [Pseudomonadota bacterium]